MCTRAHVCISPHSSRLTYTERRASTSPRAPRRSSRGWWRGTASPSRSRWASECTSETRSTSRPCSRQSETMLALITMVFVPTMFRLPLMQILFHPPSNQIVSPPSHPFHTSAYLVSVVTQRGFKGCSTGAPLCSDLFLIKNNVMKAGDTLKHPQRPK